MRRVSVLGATGSIGQNTIDLIKRAPKEYDVVALTGARNIAQLARDAIDLDAEIAVTADDTLLDDLRAALEGTDIGAAAGSDAIVEAAYRPADWIMSAIVGAAGLAPGMAALAQGTTLALANKESLVCAGGLLLQLSLIHI